MIFGFAKIVNFALLHNTLHRIILTQYSMKKGLEMFRKMGEEALSQELQQIHVFNPKKPKRR